jgi:two-component system cell cycle sensor histidine kinase/response regulator CckA
MDKFHKRYPQLDRLVEDQALESANIGITITDPNQMGNPIVYVNAGFLRMTGYEKDEVLGKNCNFLQGSETDNAARQKISIGLREQCDFTVMIKNYRKNRTSFWNELHISPIISSEGTLLFFIGFQTDATERVLLENSLRLARQRQEELIEASGDFFWEATAKGIFSFISNRIEDCLGLSPGEMQGKSIYSFLAKEDLEDSRLLLDEAMLAKRSFRNLKLSFAHKSGKQVWLRLNGTPRFDVSSQEFSGFLGSGSDVSEEQSKLMDTYRLSALGQVSAEIAHEIANPLAVIDGNAALIEEMLKAPEADTARISRSIQKIQKMVVRTQKIITSAKGMAKNGNGDLVESVFLHQLVLDSVELCAGKLRSTSATIDVEVEPKTLSVHCRPIQLSQVIINLISNACDALKSQPEVAGSGRWIRLTALLSGDHVEIQLVNSGPNAFEAVDRALNKPFQSTKSGSSGTGLGLHLVKKIIKSHGGAVTAVATTENTCVVVSIPLTPSKELLMAS